MNRSPISGTQCGLAFAAACFLALVALLCLGATSGATAQATSALQRQPDAPLLTPTPTATGACAPIPIGPWVVVTPMPSLDIYGNTGASDGTYYYSMGGIHRDVLLAGHYRYDPTSSTWTVLADMPVPTLDARTVYQGGKLYVFGGIDYIPSAVYSDTRIYDIAGDTWSVGAPMPAPRLGSYVGQYNGKIYVAGGLLADDRASGQAQTWEYDVASNTWLTKTNMPDTNALGAYVVYGQYLYTFGGWRGANCCDGDAYRYDMANDVWTTIASLPTPREGSQASLMGNTIWVYGGNLSFVSEGRSGSKQTANSRSIADGVTTNEVYSIANDSYSVGPALNQPRARFAGGNVGLRSIAVAGYTGETFTNNVEVTTLTDSCTTPTPTPACSTYDVTTTAGATVVPGTTDTGNHCFDCSTALTLPFPVTLYGQTYTLAQVGADGYMSFGATYNYNPTCLPAAAMTYAIVPFWAEQNTAAPGKGIYTLVSGTAPNRTFYIEWRNCLYNGPTGCLQDGDTDYEVIFQEGQDSFDVVYGTMGSATAGLGARGVQRNGALYTQASCNVGATTGERLAYSPAAAVCPTDTPVPTSTPPAPTNTPVFTATPYPTPPSCDPGWRVAPRQGTGAINSVYATASGDAWAAGDDGILHWDGTQWVIVGPTGGYSHIQVVGPNDAWGIYTPVTGISTIGHWNGTDWTVSPYPGDFGCCTFNDLSAWSPTDIWAVGYWQGFDRHYVLFHWDGTAWLNEGTAGKHLDSPVHPAGGGYDWFIMERVAAVGPGEMWTYGYEVCYGYSGCHNGPLTVHFCWTNCETGLIPTTNEFKDGAVVTPTDRWVIAGFDIYHWDGTAWAIQSHPDVGSLTSIAASAPNDAWAAGPGGILHWDGASWTLTFSPGGASDLASSRSNDAWAARGADILHYPSFQLFTDVQPSSTFYIYINALACRGIINGYTSGCETGDPCFRPGNDVTRGQDAKIVSLAAGFNEPVSGRSFEDVLPGSTFYDYVERLAVRGVMQGYPCGGPGEPCGPGNLPYFRPNSNVTRGQMTKIVSNASGFTDNIPAGQYTFTDMPPDSTYWLYVERLLLERPGVMTGYPCGGVGEPCDAQNRPYFRPGNNLTRGQASKIVSNSFFPAP
ncbi:MAG: S-layer homology domain-containing protein [Chloroflexota bacterium]